MVDCSFDEMFLTFFPPFFKGSRMGGLSNVSFPHTLRHDICMSGQRMDGREGDADVG